MSQHKHMIMKIDKTWYMSTVAYYSAVVGLRLLYYCILSVFMWMPGKLGFVSTATLQPVICTKVRKHDGHNHKLGFGHYNDVIMTTMASQITNLNRLFRRRSKKTSKLRVTGLCVGNSPDRWISRTKGQLRGKCFHLMTSSWSWNNSMCWMLYFVHTEITWRRIYMALQHFHTGYTMHN